MKGLIFIFGLSASLAYGQFNVKPFIKTGGAFSKYRYSGPSTIDVNILGGAHFNEFICVGVGVNNFKSIYGSLVILTFLVSPAYRVLDSKHIFSPVLAVDFGTEIWSNMQGEFVDGSFNAVNYSHETIIYGAGVPRYKRNLFFGKLKLLADFKINLFNISIGPTFNLMNIKLENVEKTYSGYSVLSEGIDRNIGFGGELSLMYTFSMKKKQSNKAVGQ